MPNFPVPVDRDDRILVSRDLNADAPWLDPADAVSLSHILRAAAEHGGDPASISTRLAELGHRVPTAEQLAAVTEDDLKLLSQHFDGCAPFIGPQHVSLLRGHVFKAARRLKRSPADIAARYAELGLQVPRPEHLPESVEQEDLSLASQSFSGGWPWQDEDDPRLRSSILWAAHVLQRTPADIAARYAALGYRVPDPASLPEQAEVGDFELLRERRPGRSQHWIADDEPVPLGHVLATLPYVVDATDDPQRAVAAIASLCERFTGLGYRIHCGAAEVTAADLHLVSEELNGRAPWLDQEKPVPFHHLLRGAHVCGLAPREVAARLTRLGYQGLPEAPLEDSVDADTIGLLSRTLGKDPVWLGQDDPEWFLHLVAVGAHTGRPLAEIADLLRRAGFHIPQEELPSRTTEQDLKLLSRRIHTAAEPWLSRTDPVPVSHVLAAAHVRKTSTGPVLARLRELGCTRLPALPDRTVTNDDLRLISERGNGHLPFLEDTVPYGRVVRAAADSGTSVRQVAEIYRGLGYTEIVLPAGPLPQSVPPRDVALIEVENGWLTPGDAVPTGHVLQLAHDQGTDPADVRRRLHALGFRRLPETLPDTVLRSDLIMVRSGYWSQERWLPTDSPVPAGHINHAATDLNMTPCAVANRLLALGHTLTYTPEPEDDVFLSQNADGRAPWPMVSHLGQVLLAAKLLGRTPAEINDRRGELGHRSPALPEVDRFDDEDIILLSQDVDLRGPWLDADTVVPVKHVLRAARATDRSPQAVAERLTRLGHPVHVSPAVSVDDNDLLETLPPFDGAVPVEHILDMVNRTGMSPAQVVARLSVLNCPVPVLNYPTSRPAATPERQNPHPQ
ncbi:hypothetical protein [Streptomyces sp. NPDC006285]|uniref:wHTH domain-containing protein n=1 Tax=Streptomyces sp. NPDC006285 TaxID=3364742 RepID=UPI0036941D28